MLCDPDIYRDCAIPKPAEWRLRSYLNQKCLIFQNNQICGNHNHPGNLRSIQTCIPQKKLC